MSDGSYSAETGGGARLRDKAIALSIGTSFVSKLGSLLLQLVALPIAVRSMGVDGFALYTLCGGTLTIISFADLGAGPMMVRRIASSIGRHRPKQIGQAIFSGALTSAFAALVLIFATVLILGDVIPGVSLKSNSALNADVVKTTMMVALVAGLLQLLASYFGRILAGFQMMHISNLGTAVGVTAGSAVTILLGRHAGMQPWMLIAAVFIPTTSVQIIVSAWILRKRAVFRLGLRHGSLVQSWQMIGEGVGFAVFGGLVPFLEREGTKWMAVRVNDLSAVAHIGLGFQLIALCGGAITMLSSPLAAAIADAGARGDYGWLTKRFRQMRLLLVGIVCVAILGGLLFGPQLISLALGSELEVSRLGMLGITLSFALYAWVHLHWAVVSAFGYIWTPALLGIGEAITTMFIYALVPRIHEEVSLFFILPLTMLLYTAVVLPRAVARFLGRPITPVPH